MSVLQVTITFILLFVLLIVFFKWKYTYWRKRNIPYLVPQIPLGNITNPILLRKKPGYLLHQFYERIKKNGWKHAGIYILTQPIYFVVDLDYVKNILTKNFEHFDDRGIYYNEKDDPVSAHLLFIGGPQWKTLRNKLNPTFTSRKIKTMFPIMSQCAENLVKKVEKKCQENTAVDIEKILSCFTINNIGRCAFGLECAMFDDDDSAFKFCTQKCVEISHFSLLTLMLASMFPKFARTLRIKHYSKEVSTFFLRLVTDCVKHREEKGYWRQDFMQLLIDLHHKNMLTIEEMAAQCLIFFLAGYETSTASATFALYELAKNQEIQEKVRKEICKVMVESKEITYETMSDMKYLNQIIDETMRKYPAIMYLTRKCTKNYTIPHENITIEKGTIVVIPNYEIHYDEEYYPDPQKFDPERFSDENKSSRHHYAHLPFGEGPRICIGKRFGLMQVKIGLVFLLRHFKFTVNSKTREPLKLTINSVVLKPESKIWLDVHRV